MLVCGISKMFSKVFRYDQVRSKLESFANLAPDVYIIRIPGHISLKVDDYLYLEEGLPTMSSFFRLIFFHSSTHAGLFSSPCRSIVRSFFLSPRRIPPQIW